VPILPDQWSDSESACVRFRLGERGFGIPLSQVREIAVAEKVTPVPLAPPVVRGIAGLHGHVITLIDVSAIFGLPLPPARCREDRLMVILGEPYQHLGLYVHAPVEIGRAVVEPAATASAVAPMVMVAASGGHAEAGTDEGQAAQCDEASETIIHLVSAGEMFTFCDARVLEGFRRKA
jgi:purine-binding chemotaxis protein CheW